jgi:glutamate/tyrosine decarboxylase-like PLP-dependent enzyme
MADQAHAPLEFSSLLNSIGDDLELSGKKPIDATGWFLGPKAENAEALKDLVAMAVQSQIDIRHAYMPDDPPVFSGESKSHERSIARIRDELQKLLGQLKGSIPLASYRNQSHMYWDITLPGAVGYFAAMLYNQNNVAAEASPVTTLLEIQVGKDLCKMLGFESTPASGLEPPVTPWGHITCDGSIANGEAMWAARNLKFLPVAMAEALANEPALESAQSVTVKTARGPRARLIDLSRWEQLNLPVDEVIGLVPAVVGASGLEQKQVRRLLDPYTLQSLGLVAFQQRYLESFNQAAPVVIVPATAHYSWAKTATLIGLGTGAIRHVEIDLDGRMNMVALRRELETCRQSGRPVLQVVAVMGTTEEGAVDPLLDIVRLREEYRQLGLGFALHVDGAWGGYFASILRESKRLGADPAREIDEYPELYVSDHFKRHFDALPFVDSVTLDPHKSGFIPYPAGGLCYRNGDMRYLIAFTAPVVYHDGIDITVGSYGIEGSKPGAAAVSVYLSHKVIPLDQEGYGRMLGRCLFNSKRFYAALVSMDLGEEFILTPFQRLPVEKQSGTHHQLIKQKRYLKKTMTGRSTHELLNEVFGLNQPEARRKRKQKEALEMFQSIGSDLSIIAYAFNFRTKQGINRDLRLMNELNEMIFRKLSLQPDESGQLPQAEMFVTSSSLDAAICGEALVRDFTRRSGVDYRSGVPLRFLISTTQNPWLSSVAGDIDMIDVLMRVLRKTVRRAVKKIIKKYDLNKSNADGGKG